MFRALHSITRILLLVGLVFAGDGANAEETVDFNQDVRPILSDNCFACHGPDSKAREGELRLDVKSDLADPDREIVVAGDPKASVLYQRITADDPDVRMPPADGHKQLKPTEISLIERWIKQGADYQLHWSFERPQKAEIPAADSSWPTNEIDHFVLARMQSRGLSPSPEARKETLLRRVTFDLTGLPPTLAEIDNFLNDSSPNAYERVVDRLLQSEHYGEHRARYWLDAARYGDTHGLHLDNYREMWPYRDWVIGVFNKNMPFDQFVVEQLAGDLLPEPTLEQIVATGFNRSHVTTNEGGTIAEEFYVRNVVDRVATTGEVFMGLTLGCAVCHDHKFDPVSQTEFYQLFAFFNNIDGSPMDGNVKDHPPYVHVPTKEQTEKLEQLKQTQAETSTKRAERIKTAQPAFASWLEWQQQLYADGGSVILQSADPQGLTIHLPLDEGSGKEAVVTTSPKNPARVRGKPNWISGKRGNGFQFTEGNAIYLGKHGVLSKTQSFSFGAWIKTPGNVTGAAIAKIDENRVTGYELQIKKRRIGVILARSFPDLTLHVETNGDVLAPNKWQHVFVTYGGTGRADAVSIYLNGKRQESKILRDQLGKYDFKTGAALFLGKRERSEPFNGGAIDDVRFYDRVLTEPQIAQLTFAAQIEPLIAIAPDKRTPQQNEELRTFYMSQYDKPYRDLTARLASLRAEEAALRKQMPTTLVFRERSEMRPAFFLERGEYDQKRDKVERVTPAVFPPMADDLPRNRLGLAKWLVSPEHPLTARVTVNRFWQQLFGVGLVKTSEDFGSQGAPPSHPELLDWLAVDFQESGWNVKRLLKNIVTSSTYRQSSKVGSLHKIDPENRLLARGPRFRLDAEMLRDQALAVSGLLVHQIGGPSVKPPQPDGLWFAVGYSGSNTVRFKQDTGSQKVHRRTIYTFIKRTSPPPQMSILDAPSREACTLRRERTNTPLQALMLLNDPQYFEAARALAERCIREGGDDDASRIRYMFRLCTSRRPDEETVQELAGLLNDQRQDYQADPKAAGEVIQVGEVDPPDALEPCELAAWTIVANVLLNTDEVLTKN